MTMLIKFSIDTAKQDKPVGTGTFAGYLFTLVDSTGASVQSATLPTAPAVGAEGTFTSTADGTGFTLTAVAVDDSAVALSPVVTSAPFDVVTPVAPPPPAPPAEQIDVPTGLTVTVVPVA